METSSLSTVRQSVTDRLLIVRFSYENKISPISAAVKSCIVAYKASRSVHNSITFSPKKKNNNKLIRLQPYENKVALEQKNLHE